MMKPDLRASRSEICYCSTELRSRVKEVESIETIRVEVVSHSIASPPLSSSGVGGVAFSVGPAHPEVGGLAGHKVVHLISMKLKGDAVSSSPLDIVDQLGLQQQISLGQQVITDEVLIGPHSDAVTHTQRAEHIQNLKENGK
ncbi:hypothetical protein EYF80_002437 [Liparis tanakae]|uniref:Uncharacterized protein n=1 Tax=Liparis tanakae TaxID=230148 RepID=A0A4Z2JA56_9TELE|nr:hypothetical protein EYF80_002437 [Liparis tanakae]